MPVCHFDSYNLWILKPTHLNRGRGIHVFNDLDQLHKLVRQYCIGKKVESYQKKPTTQANAENPASLQADEQSPPQDEAFTKVMIKPNKVKFNTFIIQKYIEKPLLIHRRKFDIRVWVFWAHDQEIWFFREGYLRTSGSEFGIDPRNIDDAFVHLTNNAVQKNSTSYGQFEDGN